MKKNTEHGKILIEFLNALNEYRDGIGSSAAFFGDYNIVARHQSTSMLSNRGRNKLNKMILLPPRFSEDSLNTAYYKIEKLMKFGITLEEILEKIKLQYHEVNRDEKDNSDSYVFKHSFRDYQGHDIILTRTSSLSSYLLSFKDIRDKIINKVEEDLSFFGYKIEPGGILYGDSLDSLKIIIIPDPDFKEKEKADFLKEIMEKVNFNGMDFIRLNPSYVYINI